MDSGAASRGQGRSGSAAPAAREIWVLIFGDLGLFTLLFGYYAARYRDNAAAFALQQSLLDRGIGLLNTLLLLSSSCLVAMAVRSARRKSPVYRRQLLGAIACGFAFAVLKGFEWKDELARGISPATGDFFMLYFTLGGMHLLHVLVGLGLLALMASRRRDGRPRPLGLIEGGALFWHLVDVLWVYLFALLYLVRP